MERSSNIQCKDLDGRGKNNVKAVRYTQSAAASETPNAETIESIKEMDMLKAEPSLGKSYTDVDAMMKDLLQ